MAEQPSSSTLPLRFRARRVDQVEGILKGNRFLWSFRVRLFGRIYWIEGWL